MWSMNSGKFVDTMIVSAPAKREVTRVADGAMMKSTSPVSSAWMTMVLALMAMTSALQAILLEETFLIGDPDRRVRRRAAGPGDAHALLSNDGCRAENNIAKTKRTANSGDRSAHQSNSPQTIEFVKISSGWNARNIGR